MNRHAILGGRLIKSRKERYIPVDNCVGKYRIPNAKLFGIHRKYQLSMFLLLCLCGPLAHAQLATVYVDALNGSDSFSGAGPADTPPGSGPKATIHGGLAALADGGRLVIFAGIYAGDGIDTDGSPTNASDNADINIALSKYPQLTKALTIELRRLGTSNEVSIIAESNTVRAPNGALITHDADQYTPNFILNIPGGSLTFTSTNGTEFLSLVGRHSSGSPVASLALVSGGFDMPQGTAFRLANGSSITISDTARFLREGPQKQTDLNLTYRGSGNLTAGLESGYASFGSGILTVNKDSGSTITFPYPTSFTGNNDAVRIHSGNAIFNGALTFGTSVIVSGTAKTADLIVSTNGTVLFTAAVTMTVVNGAAHDSSISTIDNAGSGSVTFQQPVTWYASSASANAAFPASETTSIVWNAGNGSLTFDAGAVLSHSFASGTAPSTVEVAIQNNGRGTLRYGSALQVLARAATAPPGMQLFSPAVYNAGGGTLEISGAIGSRLVNAQAGSASGTVNINGPTALGSVGSASGTLMNARDGVINLGPNTLTLSGTVNHSVNGSYITSTSGGLVIDASGPVALDGGSLPRLTVQQPPGGSTKVTGGASLTALTILGGDCALQSSVSVAGGVELSGGSLTLVDQADILLLTGSYRQTGGTMNLGGNSGGGMKLLGDFTRTGGLFVAGEASGVVFGGSTLQIVRSGPALQLSSLSIDNPVAEVRCDQPLRVSGNLTINSGSRLNLGSSTVVLNGGSGMFTNNGSFDATGLGIVLGGTNSLPGGAAMSGSEILAGPGSAFSSFTIDIGIGNTCALKAAGDVRWTRSLSLLSGAFDVASPVDLSPLGVNAKLVIDVVRSKHVVRSRGSFNKAKVPFTLRLTGSLQSDYTMKSDLVADLVNVDTLQIDVNSDFTDNDGNVSTGQQRYLQFPAGIFVFGGSLEVGASSAVRLEGEGKSGHSIELTGATAAHRVRGSLTTADPEDMIVLSGERATLTGSTQPGEAALVGNIAVRSASLCKISEIRGFLGSVTTLPGSALSMGRGGAEQILAGSLVLNGNALTLEGNLEVRKGVAFNSGTINFGVYDLQVTTSGDFVQSSTAAGYITAGGSLVMNRPGARLRIGSTEQLGLPNLQILAQTYLESVGRVTKNLVVGSKELNGIPTLVLGQAGNDLFFTGSSITLLSNGSGSREAIASDGTNSGTPGGRLFIIGTSVTFIMNGDFSVEELVYNPPAINGTLSIFSTDLTPRVLTISDMLTHAGGQIGLGFNHLAFIGTGAKPGSRAYNRSDGTIGASTGEVRFVGTAPQQFSCGAGFSVPNLRIWNPYGVAKSPNTDPIIITKTLDLSDGTFTFDSGTLIIENGATVVRRKSAAMISGPLSFRSNVNVSYLLDPGHGNLRTGPELPSDQTLLAVLRISNPNRSADSSSVMILGDVTVKERIVLDAGRLDVGNGTLTLSPGGVIEVNGGRIQASSGSTGRMGLSTYSLIYSKSGIVNQSSLEFQSGSNISVTKLSIVGSDPKDPAVVRLYANRTIEKLHVEAPGGGIEFGAPGSFVARNLTVRDSLTVLNGSFTNTAGTNAVINLAGAAKQVLTLPDTGLVLPGGASAIHLQLNNAAGFQLKGGDLKFDAGSIIFFVNGVLDAGVKSVVLARTATSQGFDRQGVGTSRVSHIIGSVRHFITGGAGNPDVYPNGRYEFPTGTATHYRPLIIAFTSVYPAKNPGMVGVAHVDKPPQGNAGWPIDGGLGVRIGSVAPFHWSLNASPGILVDSQLFDLESICESPGFRISKVADLRLVHRPDGPPETSNWNLLGTVNGYGSNSLTLTPKGDTVLTVRVQAAGQRLEGVTLLSIGIPLDRKPYLNFRVPSSISQVPLNVPTTFKVSVTDPDNKSLTVLWKVNGVTVKDSPDTSFTHTFQAIALTNSVRAVFRNSDGLADSTEWSFVVVGVGQEDAGLPTASSLGQNYPNPFNPTTTIEYQISGRSVVTLKVYDVLGKVVAVLTDGIRSPGWYSVRWDAAGLPSGTYICRLQVAEVSDSEAHTHIETRRMLLAK